LTKKIATRNKWLNLWVTGDVAYAVTPYHTAKVYENIKLQNKSSKKIKGVPFKAHPVINVIGYIV